MALLALSGNSELVFPVRERLEKMGLQVETIRGSALCQWWALRSLSIAGNKFNYSLSFDFVKGTPAIEWHGKIATENYAHLPSFHVWQPFSQNGSLSMLNALMENMRSGSRGTGVVIEQPPSLSNLLKKNEEYGNVYAIVFQHCINALDMDKATWRSEAEYRGLMGNRAIAQATEFFNRTIENLLRTNIPTSGTFRAIESRLDILKSLSESRKRVKAIHIEVPREYADSLGFFNSFANAMANWVQETMERKK
ncbi:MAG: hypothetical protein NTV88_00135 [Candidatus Micrarchaeota archaeon]|nr:hypothetical protein [Candidatus Micrarchaeota archaeon]